MRLHGVALGLTIAGQGKLAKRVLSGWKVGLACLQKGLCLMRCACYYCSSSKSLTPS